MPVEHDPRSAEGGWSGYSPTPPPRIAAESRASRSGMGKVPLLAAVPLLQSCDHQFACPWRHRPAGAVDAWLRVASSRPLLFLRERVVNRLPAPAPTCAGGWAHRSGIPGATSGRSNRNTSLSGRPGQRLPHARSPGNRLGELAHARGPVSRARARTPAPGSDTLPRADHNHAVVERQSTTHVGARGAFITECVRESCRHGAPARDARRPSAATLSR